jgi:1,5-anhydro-D-fructose reductase (1,5-anhydro-D-mannitol-forming)
MTQTQKSFGWGLIGTGRHADRLVAPAIYQSSTGRLIAVLSRDMQRARMFAERHGHPSTYDDLDALLEDPRIHAVFICSPNNVHKEQVVRAARAGKHVLCEKPLATTVDDCLMMIEACRQAGVKLGVGFHLRHNPAHILAKEMIASGAIGELLFAEIQYMHVTAGAEGKRQSPAWRMDPDSAGGGSFVGTGVHAVDLLRFVLEREITHVFALADASWYVSRRERLMQVSLLMEGQRVGSLSAGNLRYPANELVLYGELATLRCSGSIGNFGGGRIELISDQGVHKTEVDPCDVYVREVDSFADSVQAGIEPNASGYDGLQVVKVTSGVYESLRSRSLVALRPCPSNK